MTKEEFTTKILLLARNNVRSERVSEFVQLTREFLDTNVVIPKGENRHPYADVLHEWIEDISKDIQICTTFESVWQTPTGLYDCKFRIKPKEPVYVYDIKFNFKDGKSFVIEGLTSEEAHEFAENIGGERTYTILSNTKRERK